MIVLWVPADGNITFRYILLFGARLMVGFRGLSIEPSVLLSVLQRFWTWELSLPLEHSLLLIGGALTLRLVAFGGTSNFSSGITLCCNISLFCRYLAPSLVDTTYDLGLFALSVDITMAGCHMLTLGAFWSHLAAVVEVMVASLA